MRSSRPTTPGPRSIAVVGSGIAGLTAAAELHRAGHEVTVFEGAGYAGGHTNTVTASDGEREWPVDTGFIVLNDRNYPNFEAILGELGVATRPTTMSFSVADERGDFEWASTARGLFAKPSHLADRRFIRMLRDFRRFNRELTDLIAANGSGPSLRDFLADAGYGEYFTERWIVPQVAAIWSADPEQLWDFPVSFLARFFHNHGTLELREQPQWKTVEGGSATYVRALSAPFADRIRLRTPVLAVVRLLGGEGVRLVLDDGTADFDEVVLAVHSDQALRMLAHPTKAEHEVLSAIPYQRNEATLHTDTAMMPRRRAAWASWNYHLLDEPSGLSTLTYDMNRLQGLGARRRFLVTLNRTEAIDPAKVIRTIGYSHPVFSREGVAAQARWEEISGADRIHYCGAWWRWGFHEDGCWSGLRVAQALGGRGPGLGGKVPAAVDIDAERLAADTALAAGREAVAA